MAGRKKENGSRTPAVAYVRMSSERQEASPAQQRAEIEKYAKAQGYDILRWYVDEAISGDATERRQQFQRMIADAERRDFEAILCWDQDRFGRFDSIEAGRWIYPLRKAGIRLVTMAQGVIDWSDFSGRLLYGIQQEANHQFLRDLSRNTTRGQMNNARQGFLCGQAAPYGFDRMLVDERGQHQQRVRNGEKYAKNKQWRVMLVPSDDPIKAATVRWLFTTYARQDVGYRWLADDLNARGIPSPSGGQWFDSSVRAILTNCAYIGTFVWGRRREGKYHWVAGTEILQRDPREVHLSPRGKPNAIENPSDGWTVVQDAHEPLVERDVFHVVQAKIQRRSRRAGEGYRTHTKGNGDAYLLSGLVFCRRCGRKMHGCYSGRQKNGKDYRYPRYVCSTYSRSGAHCDSGCHHFSIRQELIYDVIIAKLRESLLAGGNLERLKQALRERLQQRCKPDADQLERLRSRLKQLDKELERFAKDWFRLPESLLDQLAAEADAKKRERDLVARQLDAAETSAQPVNQEAIVDEAAKKVWTLAEELEAAEPARLRELMPIGGAGGSGFHRTSPRKTMPVPPHGWPNRLPQRVVRFCRSGRKDLNLRPLRPERVGGDSQVMKQQKVTDGHPPVCSTVCTRNSNGGVPSDVEVAALAELLQGWMRLNNEARDRLLLSVRRELHAD
jgi:DNA invertase Pin-like site-specific DNA recombinase